MITALSSESAVPYRSAKAPDIWADEDAAEDVGFMPHTVCRRQEGTPGVQTLTEDRACLLYTSRAHSILCDERLL